MFGQMELKLGRIDRRIIALGALKDQLLRAFRMNSLEMGLQRKWNQIRTSRPESKCSSHPEALALYATVLAELATILLFATVGHFVPPGAVSEARLVRTLIAFEHLG